MPINNYCPEDYLNEGNKLFNLERYHEAITYYKYAKNLEPTNSLSYFYIALSNYKLDHPKLAMDYINNNLYLGEDPAFYALKGILLMELGRPQEAFDSFQTFIACIKEKLPNADVLYDFYSESEIYLIDDALMGYFTLLNESSYLKGKAKAEQYAVISDILDDLYKEKSEELEGIHKELHFQQLRALTEEKEVQCLGNENPVQEV